MQLERSDVSFQRPVSYWLRRAEKCGEQGDMRRAATLLRHAARIEPTSAEPLCLYAETLSELGCYEAGNREAFAALAKDPQRFSLYGLIAQNLSHIGFHQEAMDAFSLFILSGRKSDDDFNLWDYDYEISERYDEHPRRRERLNGLLNIAARRIAMGDWNGATRALTRACQKPFHAPCAYRDVLLSTLMSHCGENALAKLSLLMAMKHANGSAFIYCAAARAFARLRPAQKALSRSALLRAMACVQTTHDEIIACEAFDLCGQRRMCASLLTSRLQAHPDCLSTCFNLATCYLKLGEAEKALPLAHLCRELDPDDLCAEALLGFAQELDGLSAAEVAARSQTRPYYGMLLADDLESRTRPLALAASENCAAFAQQLADDALLRKRYLQLLNVPESGLEPTLHAVCEQWSPEFAQTFLRELLMTAPGSAEVQLSAMRWLVCLGARPPFTVWQPGRMLSLDPTQPPHVEASFYQRQLARRIKQAAVYAYDPGFVPAALQTVNHLTHPQRCKLIANSDGLWVVAFAMLVCRRHGLATPRLTSADELTPESVSAIRKHYAVLCHQKARRS